ncbi:MAG: signal peptidase I [Bacilli bacterium]|nr:signal peptidase I [Bacilli bacterium]
MENTGSKTKTWKIIGNVVFWVVLVLVVLYSVVALFSEEDENQTTFLGMTAYTVESDSMETEFYEGDLIFVRTEFNVDDLLPEDIVTFRDVEVTDEGSRMFFNTHRIIRISDDRVLFYTQGDNAPEDEQPITANDIVGVYTGVHLRWMGSFINFLKSSLGFLLFIVLPCLAFLVYEIVRFTKVYSQYQVQKTLSDRVKMQEEAVALAKAELEKEQAQAKTKDATEENKD